MNIDTRSLTEIATDIKTKYNCSCEIMQLDEMTVIKVSLGRLCGSADIIDMLHITGRGYRLGRLTLGRKDILFISSLTD